MSVVETYVTEAWNDFIKDGYLDRRMLEEGKMLNVYSYVVFCIK